MSCLGQEAHRGRGALTQPVEAAPSALGWAARCQQAVRSTQEGVAGPHLLAFCKTGKLHCFRWQVVYFKKLQTFVACLLACTASV